MISRFLTFFLTTFLFFNFGSFFSQNTNLPLNKLNKKGEKIGKWKVLHENSNQLRYSGQFENNIPTGNFIYYYPSGNLSAKMKYINDSVSYVSHYHDNGHFMGAGKFINKLKDSLWTIYNRQGQLIGKSFYKWFQKTKWGIWFDKKMSRFLDKVTGKHEEAVTKKAQIDMF